MSEVVGPGTELSGRYRVLEQGTSDVPGVTVWNATDQILDRPVRAVVLAKGDVSSALDGARRAALVSDPRLARVLDVGMHDGYGYVVTEDVSGPTLADLVARGPLTPDQARAVIGEAAAPSRSPAVGACTTSRCARGPCGSSGLAGCCSPGSGSTRRSWALPAGTRARPAGATPSTSSGCSTPRSPAGGRRRRPTRSHRACRPHPPPPACPSRPPSSCRASPTTSTRCAP